MTIGPPTLFFFFFFFFFFFLAKTQLGTERVDGQLLVVAVGIPTNSEGSHSISVPHSAITLLGILLCLCLSSFSQLFPQLSDYFFFACVCVCVCLIPLAKLITSSSSFGKIKESVA